MEPVVAEERLAEKLKGLKSQHSYDRIPLAAEFRPTEEEFREPLDYINKIRPVAEAYGICKIVPPANWRPKFSLDMNLFKFRPRVQRLNELEANNRIKLQFLDKLAQFWELQGKRFRNPVLEGKPVDLYKLLKIVGENGGMDVVTNGKRWSQLARQLDYKEAQSARILRGHYENLLHPYELFEAGSTLPPQQPVKVPSVICLSDEDPAQGGRCGGGGKKRTMQPAASNKRQAVDSRRSSSNNSDNQICLVCKRGDDEAFMLLCDECDDSYHTFCLVPPLKEVPKGDWRCPVCLAAICKEPGESYGFEQSKHSYTLAEFSQMADKFKRDYFKGKKSVSLEECEQEFWRILSSPDEDVVVEYGADLHTIDTGSGFPTRSDRGKLKHNTDPYVDSPWNLNNLSMLEKSVLSQINVPISGMKIPWAYVGMCFSCFCWHVEDHWSYSINYLHLGEAKTWYGVSGADAEKFEAVMKESAKELFDKSPDLLHHLVTIMDPKFLRSKGVPIYKIFQQEGEFVITFPRAYHAGFNQGFNFAEAVNFCPPDWIPIGRKAIESYKVERRHTVFSHDELVCRVADHVDRLDIETALALEQEFNTMVAFEKAFRRSLADRGIKKGTKFEFDLLNDDERTCDYCKTTCYLSAVRCFTCNPHKMVCLNHFDHVCDGGEPVTGHAKSKIHDFKVLYKFDLNELVKVQGNLTKKAEEYTSWQERVRRAFDDYDIEIIDELEPNKPLHLNELQKLLDHAKLKRYPRYDVEIGSNGRITRSTSSDQYSLYSRLERECLKGAQCAKMCQKFIEYYKSPNNEATWPISSLFEDTDPDNKAYTLKRSLSSKCVLAHNVTHHKPSFAQLRQLYQDVKSLVCQIDEKELFMSLMTEAIDFEARTRKLIETTDLEIISDNLVQQLEAATSYLKRVDIEFPAELIDQLQLLSNRVDWLIKSRELVTGRCTVKTVQALVDQFVEQNLVVKHQGRGRPSNLSKKNDEIMHGILVHVQELLSLGQTWDDRALAQMQTPNIRIEELEKTLIDARNIPLLLENVEKLERFLKEANKSIVQADALLSDPNYPYLSDLKDACRQIKSGSSSVRTNSYEGIHIRVERTKEWIGNLSKACLKPESWHHTHHHHQNSADSLMNISLLEALTPRMDIKSVINKLQLVLDTITDVKKENSENLSIEQGAATTTPPNISAGKRQHRTKSGHISQLNTTGGSQQLGGSFSLDSILNHIDSVSDLYRDRNLLTLSEKYKLLQAKELEYIKTVRRLNSEKLTLIKAHIIDELRPYESEQSSGESVAPVADWSKQSLVGIKCCSCSKSILPAVYARSVQQCKLCLGLFHNNCKNASGNKYDMHHHVYSRHAIKHTLVVDRERWDFCHGCERSKRPKLDTLASMLVHFENLQTRCYEANALQMFIDRILKWQERYKATVTNNEVARLLELTSRYRTNKSLDDANEILTEMRALSESINVVKRTELSELQLEGMLMESELEESVKMNDLFYLLDQNKPTELDQLTQALSSEEPRVIQYLDEKMKVLNKLNEELKKEKKANQKSQKTTSQNSTEARQAKDSGNKVAKGPAGKKGKNSEKNGKVDAGPTKKKNQKENASRGKKRDHSEVDEISDELCAAPKCTQPSGDNIKWVQCDGECNRWFHMTCMGISKIRKREQYICDACGSTNNARLSTDSVNVTVDSNLIELKVESDETALTSHVS